MATHIQHILLLHIVLITLGFGITARTVKKETNASEKFSGSRECYQ